MLYRYLILYGASMPNTTNREKNIKIGQYVQEAREKAKVTQGQMAISLGLSKNHISAIERGRSKMSVDILLGYCNRLKTTPDEILHYTKSRSMSWKRNYKHKKDTESTEE